MQWDIPLHLHCQAISFAHLALVNTHAYTQTNINESSEPKGLSFEAKYCVFEKINLDWSSQRATQIICKRTHTHTDTYKRRTVMDWLIEQFLFFISKAEQKISQEKCIFSIKRYTYGFIDWPNINWLLFNSAAAAVATASHRSRTRPIPSFIRSFVMIFLWEKSSSSSSSSSFPSIQFSLSRIDKICLLLDVHPGLLTFFLFICEFHLSRRIHCSITMIIISNPMTSRNDDEMIWSVY